jgi:hypothetical protein
MLSLKKMLALCCSLASSLFAFDKLPSDYLVTYGSEDAKLTIIQYYSFTCPHCIALFRKEFQKIKEHYIEPKNVYWVFHPVPMDLLTVQAMDCLSKLSERDKKIFLEAVLEEVIIDNPKLSANFLQKAMEIFENPIPKLQDKDYLSNTTAFTAAFHFLKQDDSIEVIPSVEVNGTFIPAQIPDCSYIDELLKEAL